jgi:membrane protein YdbS with pleckstrin-like domain
VIRWLDQQRGWRLTLVLYGFCGLIIAVFIGIELGLYSANHGHRHAAFVIWGVAIALVTGMAPTLRYFRHRREASESSSPGSGKF